MNYDYCNSCGSKIEYLLKKPNFCPSCGGPQGTKQEQSTSSQPLQKSRASARPESPPEDMDSTDIDTVPQIQNLQYVVDTDYSSLGKALVPIQDILGSGPPGSPSSPVANDPPADSDEVEQGTAPTLQEKFEAVKGSIEACKSSVDNTVDVGEK